MKIELTFTPRLMKAQHAAQFVGVSVSKFRTLDIPAKRSDGNILYDKHDLDEYADNLPYDGEGENSCDAAFGIVS